MSPKSLAFSIARRYFAQRKRFHAVQVVSAISSVAVGVVVMAVVAILSIYNGYEEVLFMLRRTYWVWSLPIRARWHWIV